MDAYVQLALVEKARRVFSTNAETFLSFPVLAPLSMSADALAAIAAPKSVQDLLVAADFARLVNFVPRDTVATLDGGRTLWEIYADVLARAVVAAGVADPVAEDRRKEALDTLYTTGADGMRQESAAFRTYRQFRDAWFTAQEDFRAKKLTGETSDDPAVRQQWSDQGPRLRAHLADLESDWRNIGFRDEVEAALAVLEAASAANPIGRWREWQSAFNPDLDLITAESGRFAPTGYSPVNLDSDEAWSRFEISMSEIQTLVADAPEELRRALQDDPDRVEKVSFDYRSVTVTRPWFFEAALTSRIWQMPAGEAELSDGAAPPEGQCPAFVAALVLMRRLEVQRPSGTTTGGAVTFDLPLHYLTQRVVPAPDEQIKRWRELTHIMPKFDRKEITDVAHVDEIKKFDVLREREFSTTVVGPRVNREPLLLDREALDARVALPGSVRLQGFRRRPGAVEVLGVRDGIRVWDRFPEGEASGPVGPIEVYQPPAAGPASTDVTVLAFICKRLPKTPDPLPDLNW